MSRSAAVCNTSPLLYLGRIERLDLLSVFYAPVYVPQQVVLELDAGRLLRRDTVDPRTLEWVTIVPVTLDLLAALPENKLGLGEQAAIAYALKHPEAMLILDDREARQVAATVHKRITGTLGLLVHAKRAKLIEKVAPLLAELEAAGFRLKPLLRSEVLRLAGEDATGRIHGR